MSKLQKRLCVNVLSAGTINKVKTIRAAKVLVVVNDEVLLLRNSATHPRWPFYSDLPGGTVEEGESTEDTVIRETFEETSIKLDKKDLQLIHGSTMLKPDVYIVYQLYRVDLPNKPDITLSYEHDEYKWVPLSDAAKLEPHYQQAFDYLKSNNLL
jgi:8-oxo-dGTP pyrophosphatase MutT (NUDIX family)